MTDEHRIALLHILSRAKTTFPGWTWDDFELAITVHTTIDPERSDALLNLGKGDTDLAEKRYNQFHQFVTQQLFQYDRFWLFNKNIYVWDVYAPDSTTAVRLYHMAGTGRTRDKRINAKRADMDRRWPSDESVAK